MALGFYIVPIATLGGRLESRFPKYFYDGTISFAYELRMVDYGFEPWMIVAADLSAPDHATISGKPDAYALPFDLTANLTAGQVTSVQNKLEAINLPAGWVTVLMKWSDVLRTVLHMFQFMRVLTVNLSPEDGPPVRLFGGSVTLATRINQLPINVVNTLKSSATSIGLVTDLVTGPTTIRATLKIVADQMTVKPFDLGGGILI